MSLERRKAYATHLLKTALRYGSDEEIAALTSVIEEQIGSMLTTRFNPGLNDASYDVFRKFWLKGGAK
jgi:predicted acetyltransferase